MPVKNKAKKTKSQAELNFEAANKAFAIARSIYKTSTAYDRASASKRRVMIAEDALRQLKLGKFIATSGTYVNAFVLAKESGIKDEVQLNTLLHNPDLKSSCDVCARGALLLSAVRHRNDCTIAPNGSTSDDSFVKEFKDQQRVIEDAFENYYDGKNAWCNKFLTKAERRSDEKRLELILKNIIRNRGTFKSNQR